MKHTQRKAIRGSQQGPRLFLFPPSGTEGKSLFSTPPPPWHNGIYGHK